MTSTYGIYIGMELFNGTKMTAAYKQGLDKTGREHLVAVVCDKGECSIYAQVLEDPVKPYWLCMCYQGITFGREVLHVDVR